MIHLIFHVSPFIRYGGKRYAYPTGESVKVVNFRNAKCKGCSEAGAINNKLVAVETAIKNAILYFKQDFKVPSGEDFKKKVELFLKGNNAIEIKRKDKKLLTYIEEYIPVSGKSGFTKRS